MKNSINRRTAVTGAFTAMVASMAIVAKAEVTPTDELVQLESLINRWKQLEHSVTIEGKAVDALEVGLNRTAPQRPAILFKSILRPDGTVLDPLSDRKMGWSQETLESRIRNKSKFIASRIDLPNGDFSITCSDRPLQEHALNQYIERRDALRVFNKKHERHYSEHGARQMTWEKSLSDLDAARNQIIAYEVRTIAGLTRKAQFFNEAPWFASEYEYQVGLDAGAALLNDVLRIVPKLQAAA